MFQKTFAVADVFEYWSVLRKSALHPPTQQEPTTALLRLWLNSRLVLGLISEKQQRQQHKKWMSFLGNILGNFFCLPKRTNHIPWSLKSLSRNTTKALKKEKDMQEHVLSLGLMTLFICTKYDSCSGGVFKHGFGKGF